ncbi:tyrosine-type recombinase/integrase [Paenibacillus abyssi]|uniref:Tyrosine recombinase XerD n=1 Tax=Paenibacillus abyssi TaxID=1340531 RepID=A0A917CG38_9BACL|nr:tyrosine-type recombinase/integrase [Paenibacillus abyssi]GGF87891.1 tyrosine recombinase XerD [Paenibacillus abyssi]
MDKRIGRRYKNTRRSGKGPASLDDLYDTFVTAKIAEGVSARTIETYEENYRFLCDYIALEGLPREFDSVTTDLLRSYINWMLTKKRKWEGHAHKSEDEKTVGLSPVTVNTRLKGLRTMFTFLYAEDEIPYNPFDKIKPVKEPEQEIEIMTAEQMERILKSPDRKTYAGFRDFVFMNVLIDGFFRINEALKIRESDINFETGLVTIPAVNAKSRKSKTVPLSRGTLKLLRDLIADNADFETDYVFLTNYGDNISDDRMRDRIKQHARKANIDVRVYPHLFRHSAATLYLENGGEIRFLAELLGHADLRMVLRYTHLSKKAVSEMHVKYSPIHNVTGKLSKERRIMR